MKYMCHSQIGNEFRNSKGVTSIKLILIFSFGRLFNVIYSKIYIFIVGKKCSECVFVNQIIFHGEIQAERIMLVKACVIFLYLV